MEEKEDDKLESKPKKMLHENMLEYSETYFKNIKEVSCLAVGKICNLYKNKKSRLCRIRDCKSYILFSIFAK